MGFDDRAANRQAYSHTAGFGRVERIKDPVEVLRLYSGPRIFYRNGDATRCDHLGRHLQHARPVCNGPHRVGSISDDIEHNLLHLPLMCGDPRKLGRQLELNDCSVGLQLAAHNCDYFLNELVDVERGMALPGHSP
jgi:hypothetical protein